MMRFIPTLFHGVIDYAVGIIFIAAPWAFKFSDVPAATWTIITAGVVVLFYSVFTDYEVGIIRKIPMPSHLMLDFGLGVILPTSPWILGFADKVYLPHLIGGVFSILASLTTQLAPSSSYRKVHPDRDVVR